jgi:hypothetical protein
MSQNQEVRSQKKRKSEKCVCSLIFWLLAPEFWILLFFPAPDSCFSSLCPTQNFRPNRPRFNAGPSRRLTASSTFFFSSFCACEAFSELLRAGAFACLPESVGCSVSNERSKADFSFLSACKVNGEHSQHSGMMRTPMPFTLRRVNSDPSAIPAPHVAHSNERRAR